MRLAVAIADEKAGASAFVVWRGFAESIPKAASYGFDGVELALRCKEDVDVPTLRSLLKAHNLSVSAISTGQMFADLNLYLTAEEGDTRARAISVLDGLVELAAEFGGMVNLGRSRGFISPRQTIGSATELFLDSLNQVAVRAQTYGVTIVVEPVNRYEINFINNVQQGVDILSMTKTPNLGVMPDVFHMNIEDAHIGDALRDAGALVKYIHFADSNRLAPGQGHLNFAEVFEALGDIGFDGWASVEILPVPTPDEAAKQAIQFLRPFMDAYHSRKPSH